MSEQIKGYKVFNSDWTCRGKKYECPGTFEEDVNPSCCISGMHFCINLTDCFDYYRFNPENKVAEVIALGDTDVDGNKTCTNKLQIVREVSWEEVLRLVNTGKANAGLCNSGDRNSGNCNSGNCNSGNCNSGDWNSGDWNSGNCNSGDWNKTNFSSGCFNTEEANIMLFNKMSDWTYRKWLDSEARYLLNDILRRCTKWVIADNMTAQEKADHPSYKTTGGYLKILDESEEAQKWWDNLSDYNRNIIKAIPNFDPDIFKECTGIETREVETND